MQLMPTATNDMSTGVTVTGAAQTTPLSKKRIWTARIMGGLVTLFLLMDAVMKVVKAPPSIQATLELGYPESAVPGIGLLLLVSLVLYVVPRTAVVGAVLLSGYLGGAIASHVRVGSPLFSHVLFPVYLAALVWGALYLRDARVRALVSPPPRA